MKKGRLNIVGIGPGNDEHITPAALYALQEADLVIGYVTYINLVKHRLVGKQVTQTGMTEEISRAQEAVNIAKEGKIVTLISSGDAGVYGMAGLVFEVLRKIGWKKEESPEVKIIPGITADSSCASLVGAPLVHDTARISLSDLLTPWSVIENRLECAAKGDFVITLYNPASGRRQRQILEASKIIKRHRSGNTPVALIKSAYRKQQNVFISDLDNFLNYEIGMNTTVIVGSNNTFIYEDFMITPRGYTNKYSLEDAGLLEGQKKGFSLRSIGDLKSSTNLENTYLNLNVTKIQGAFIKKSTSIVNDQEEPSKNLTPVKDLTSTFTNIDFSMNQSQDSSAIKAVETLGLLSKIQKENSKKSYNQLEPQKNTLAYIGRLGGAVLFKTLEKFYILGRLKNPICFEKYGFQDPGEYYNKYFELKVLDPEKVLNFSFESLMFLPNQILPEVIYEKLIIHRNSLISERILSYVYDKSEKVFLNGQEYTNISWLGLVPLEVWNLVRGILLKC
ncbi:precorrin-3B C(17)-methyltransferase [Leptospira noguchii]|uniref:Precorrin-3B C(17)-methyltransferase n=2 Tax=Leptospira noguchii TaxID=28182 RepID=M6UNT2_9LEPT|nr:precorrin-3B C(17)-methyltransferase [Leptospira noguchii]EKR71564.1 precorrin-3B C(17)-methyltransferase [Leptospira noguchii str. 2006001870]EMO42714.1 precorrin-3B C(17)-methyltransferase [Leptospira noguchii serovar Autumnalis str. ZUN142]UOG43320.1 precorrin-3B C(17)-methyltransferase [Leptospira noguchii]UOG50555.1 precorrin-3B C(17)-methyltransferase [Leptospira noguchii]UOG58692.1 precorrin-3B C(17)-methyltransferase [Leptospira noguchii]